MEFVVLSPPPWPPVHFFADNFIGQLVRHSAPSASSDRGPSWPMRSYRIGNHVPALIVFFSLLATFSLWNSRIPLNTPQVRSRNCIYISFWKWRCWVHFDAICGSRDLQRLAYWSWPSYYGISISRRWELYPGLYSPKVRICGEHFTPFAAV